MVFFIKCVSSTHKDIKLLTTLLLLCPILPCVLLPASTHLWLNLSQQPVFLNQLIFLRLPVQASSQLCGIVVTKYLNSST